MAQIYCIVLAGCRVFPMPEGPQAPRLDRKALVLKIPGISVMVQGPELKGGVAALREE